MKNILVINNDFDTMSLLKSWLEKKLYNVKFTGNHLEAINLMKVFNPSLVIIDILQHDLLLAIKSYREFEHVPVLLMTGYSSKPFKKSLRVNDIIEKPFNLPLFEKKIKKLLYNVEA